MVYQMFYQTIVCILVKADTVPIFLIEMIAPLIAE